MHFNYSAADIIKGGALSNDAVRLIQVTAADGGWNASPEAGTLKRDTLF